MRIAVLTLALAVVAAPAAAQDHEAGQGHEAGHCAMMMLGGAPLMGAMHGGPHGALMQREALGLTADQVGDMEALQARMHAEVHPHLEAAMTAHGTAAALLAADAFDRSAYEARLREASAHVVRAQLAATDILAAARGLLTAEQRAKLGAGHGAMGGMMQHGAEGGMHQGMQHGAGGGMMHQGMGGGMGGMPGAMMHCPMMQGAGGAQGGL